MIGKVLVIYEDSGTEFVDITFDESEIIAHYTTLENIDDSSINVILGSSTLTLKRTTDLLYYLETKYD